MDGKIAVEIGASDEQSSVRKKWVVNMSSAVLTKTEKDVLEKGLNFAPAPHKVPKLEIISSIEPVLRDCYDQIGAEVAQANIASILKMAVCPPPNVSKEQMKALRDLRERDDVIIAPAD